MSMAKQLAGFLTSNVYIDKSVDNFSCTMAEEEFINFKDNHENSYCRTTSDLKNYLKTSLENVLKNVTDEQFVHIYKTCYKEFEKKDDIDRPSLSGSSVEAKKYRTQFNDIVMKAVSETVEDTVSSMDNKLKKLEQLKIEQKGNTVFWRPPGNARKHMIPFEYVSQMDRKKSLEDKIQKEHQTLNILRGRLQQKRNKAKELHEVLVNLTDDIKKIVTEKIKDESNIDCIYSEQITQ